MATERKYPRLRIKKLWGTPVWGGNWIVSELKSPGHAGVILVTGQTQEEARAFADRTLRIKGVKDAPLARATAGA